VPACRMLGRALNTSLRVLSRAAPKYIRKQVGGVAAGCVRSRMHKHAREQAGGWHRRISGTVARLWLQVGAKSLGAMIPDAGPTLTKTVAKKVGVAAGDGGAGRVLGVIAV